MATKRRGGFGPPELRGTLGTLLRTTTGVVRDALERGAREGRARLDDVRTNRRRQDALAELGELVLDLIRRGEIDLAELPEAHDLVRQLDEFDADPDDERKPEPPRALTRSRFDDRAARDDRHAHDERPARDDRSARNDRSAHDDRHARDDRSARDERPARSAPAMRDTSATRDDRPSRNAPDDDGTVSSGAALRAGRPTNPGRPLHPSELASMRTPTKPIRNSWRPGLEDDVPTLDEMPVAKRSPPPQHPQRKGGITFDDDDLNEYMHPDDVPPKGPAKDPSDSDA